MGGFIDLVGQRFGKLLVIERVENYHGKAARFRCLCDCGNETIVLSWSLRSGHTRSCGCYLGESSKERWATGINHAPKIVHGQSRTRLFKIWCGIKERCLCQTSSGYVHYGGRGIKMHDAWQDDFVSFRDWAMSNGYQENLTIERVDVNGDYDPINCTWIPMKEQANNKRSTIKLTLNGVTKSMADWARELGIEYAVLSGRYRAGWSDEKILTRPVKPHAKMMSRYNLVEYKGVSKTVEEWANEIGMQPYTLSNRIFKLKWPIDKSFEAPVRNSKN